MLKNTISENPLNDERINQILLKFGVNHWQRATGLKLKNQPISISKANKTASKASLIINNHYYILKEIPWYCASMKLVESKILFQQLLKKYGLNVPNYKASTAGDYYISLENIDKLNSKAENIFTLQEYISGFQWNGSEQQAKNSASVLAKLHVISKELISNDALTKVTLSNENIVDNAIRIAQVVVQEYETKFGFLNKSELNSLSEFSRSCLEELNDIQKLQLMNKYYEEKIAIHGDYNLTNLIFNQDGNVSAIIDFDNACLANPIEDIVKFLIHLLVFPFDATFKVNSTWELAKIFVNSYLESSYLKIEMIVPFISLIAKATAIEISCIYILRGYSELTHCHHLLQKIKDAEFLVRSLMEQKSYAAKDFI